MKEKIRKLGKGLKRMIDERVDVIRAYLSKAQNRLILGLILLGLGGGLIASAYIRVQE